MCFINDAKRLKRYRARTQPFTAWKVGEFDEKTGTLYTSFFEWVSRGDVERIVKWLPGTTVKPHEIREPLEEGQRASAGLYFNTTSQPTGKQVRYDRATPGVKANLTIFARINPKDVIAVGLGGTEICCIKATITKAFTITPQQIKAAKLKRLINRCNDSIKDRDERIQGLEEEIEHWKETERYEYEQYIEQMKEELAKL